MAPGCAKVIVRPEGFIERSDQVEEGLAAALVAEGALIFTTLALAQPAQTEASTQHCPAPQSPQWAGTALAHLLGLRPEVWGGDSASRTWGWPS